MKRILACLLLVTALLQADEFDPKDNTVVLGQRVGLIKPGMTATDIGRAYGKQNLTAQKIPGAEGEQIDVTKLFAGTDRELVISWDPSNDKKQVVFDISVVGKAWNFDSGLKAGMTVEEVEKINGKPFKIAGFGWDYGGYATFEGGKLEGKVSIRFSLATQSVPEYLAGEKQLSSTDKQLRAAKPLVEAGISVFMR
jgi:hypothetical protein